MKYISLFSGIEAASVAWKPLGWEPVAFSEIAPFPSAVLAHRFPDVPNLGDMTKVDWSEYAGRADLVCGGSPCQSFSVAGLRRGLDDPRGNLALEYLRAVDRIRPKWVVWENVPGVLSSNGGRDFGAFLGGLGQLGYGWAYRVLDAQYVRVQPYPRAVPQRRRRVWVVGCLGDWRGAAAVLLERQSVCGHPSPRRESGKGAARGFETGPGVGRFAEVAPTLDCKCKDGPIRNQLGAGVLDVAHTLTQRFDSSEDGTGRGIPLVAARMVAFGEHEIDGTASTVKSRDFKDATDLVMAPAVAIQDVRGMEKAQNGLGINTDDCAYTVDTMATQGVARGYRVRRLTPRECERLQGFPDDWTDIPWRGKEYAPDGPRYKAIGNSWAVNVARWVGERINEIETITERKSA